jgi:predicted nuclease of predicted toxin-antitoxin system
MIKFLVDAQLPVRLSRLLQNEGYDTIHTRDLPRKNATQYVEINTISIQQSRIVVTKDTDFLHSFLLNNQPYKLLLVTTGNIKNQELEALFLENLSHLAELFEQHAYIELGRDTVTVHQ